VATGLIDERAAVGVQVVDTDTLEVDTDNISRFRHRVAAVAQQRHTRLYEIEPIDDDLESVFRYLVRR
jgi:ABC-2 type transport system ATP-binding protein